MMQKRNILFIGNPSSGKTLLSHTIVNRCFLHANREFFFDDNDQLCIGMNDGTIQSHIHYIIANDFILNFISTIGLREDNALDVLQDIQGIVRSSKVDSFDCIGIVISSGHSRRSDLSALSKAITILNPSHLENICLIINSCDVQTSGIDDFGDNQDVINYFSEFLNIHDLKQRSFLVNAANENTLDALMDFFVCSNIPSKNISVSSLAQNNQKLTQMVMDLRNQVNYLESLNLSRSRSQNDESLSMIKLKEEINSIKKQLSTSNSNNSFIPIEYEWNTYFGCPNVGSRDSSDPFTIFPNIQCYLKVFWGGSKECYKGYMSIYLHVILADSTNVNIEAMIKIKNEKKSKEFILDHQFNLSGGWGWPKAIPTSEIHKYINNEGKITFKVNIRIKEISYKC